jgi:hypothetical protein
MYPPIIRHAGSSPELPLNARRTGSLSAAEVGARCQVQVNAKGMCPMRAIVRVLLAVSLGAALAGCVIAPVGPRRAYVGVGVVAPAPVVVYRRW